ncbi:MAG: hypothetical protein ACLVLH_13590 [Eisenbergiella massiliensis]
MKAEAKEKKKSGAILAASAGIFVIALSVSSFFLIQIIGRMNRSANQNLLTSSRVINEGLNNKITLDQEMLNTLADLLALEEEDMVGKTLCKYTDFTDFYQFSYINMDGKEQTVREIPFMPRIFSLMRYPFLRGRMVFQLLLRFQRAASAHLPVPCNQGWKAGRGRICGSDCQ